ncbi:MAG: SBBP repeat-containing protein, partial [Bacteroidetes bacterium]|nr:SBBP repeat-containing protein [Bacteroidota bacterium]
MKKLIVICFLAICQLAVAGGGSVVSNHIPKTVYGFIENKGQIYNQDFTPNSEVKYLLNSEGLNVQLKKNSFSYDTYVLENGVLQFHRIDVVLIGANTNPEIIPQNIGRDYLNYYNAVGGVTKVNHFSKVMYKDIYNGIDLEFIASYNKSTPFKYNFIVHKGADVAQIKIEYKGTLKTKLNDGKIELTLSNGLLSESIPKSFLEETKEAVNVEYLLTNNAKEKIVSFITSNFDKTKTLIIDPSPSIIWSTYYGGALEDYGQDVVALDSGNLLITGYTTSTNAIATSGAYQTKSGLNTDAFIVKLNGKGIRQWATYYGGSNEDKGFAIAKDDSDNIVITGRTSSTNAVATLGAHQIKLGGSYDAFIAKFNTTGQLKWGTYYGGADTDIGADAIADDSGNVYATGVSKSTNSIATKGAHQDTVGGKEDAYLVKFNGNGIRQWATYNGGEAYDEGESISKDKFGNIYISGKTASTKNISTSWVYQTALAGYYDVFLSKFDKSGIRIWGTYYGGKLADYGLANTTDDSGNIYVTGQTLSTTKMATKGIYQDSLAGGRDAFLVKFNTKGNIVWGTYYGGKDDDLGHNIISYKNNLYIIGWTNSSTGISTNGSYQNTIGGNTDAFLLGFNDEGKRQWGSYLGGKGNDFA